MSQRKGAAAAGHFTKLAEEFEVTPELAFLMESNVRWNNIVTEIRNINRGINRRSELSSEVDILQGFVLGLQVLLKGK